MVVVVLMVWRQQQPPRRNMLSAGAKLLNLQSALYPCSFSPPIASPNAAGGGPRQ
jgi:hypothetical protein